MILFDPDRCCWCGNTIDDMIRYGDFHAVGRPHRIEIERDGIAEMFELIMECNAVATVTCVVCGIRLPYLKMGDEWIYDRDVIPEVLCKWCVTWAAQNGLYE